MVGAQAGPDSVRPTARYAEAARVLERFINHEMADKTLPALSIALVDGQTIVWARGFGLANPGDSTPATATTVYRVGSVSKLFTHIGVMQLVERGTLNLDAPVSRYVHDFRPSGPGASAITLRQLMSHRAGLVREPPVGHYFDKFIAFARGNCPQPARHATRLQSGRQDEVLQRRCCCGWTRARERAATAVPRVPGGRGFASDGPGGQRVRTRFLARPAHREGDHVDAR